MKSWINRNFPFFSIIYVWFPQVGIAPATTRRLSQQAHNFNHAPSYTGPEQQIPQDDTQPNPDEEEVEPLFHRLSLDIIIAACSNNRLATILAGSGILSMAFWINLSAGAFVQSPNSPASAFRRLTMSSAKSSLMSSIASATIFFRLIIISLTTQHNLLDLIGDLLWVKHDLIGM